MRAPVMLSSVVLALALSTSCAASSEDSTSQEPAGTPESRAPATTQEPLPTRSPTPSPSPSWTAPDADPEVHKESGPYDLVLEDVSVVKHARHDRIVLRFAGAGTPGWVAGFVDEAVLEGSGDRVELDGDAILQIFISGTPTPDPESQGPIRRELGGDVVDLHAVGAWEGSTQVFVGLRGGRTPFRVSALTSPSRLVVDVE